MLRTIRLLQRQVKGLHSWLIYLFVSITNILLCFCSFDLSCPISKMCMLYCLVLLNKFFFNLVCFDLLCSASSLTCFRYFLHVILGH